jgi:hypothetical protein
MSLVEENLKQLPRSIWIPTPSHTIYRGSPTEIVCEMSPSPLQNKPLRHQVRYLLKELEKKRSLVIGLPDDVEDEVFAGLFVYALLDVGIARPSWLA